MQTFLIVSSNTSFIEKEVEKFKDGLDIYPYSLHQILPSPSIGITEVRTLAKILTLKPLYGKNRLVVIKKVEKATLPAQNSLLKMLEEPPKATYIVLTASNTLNLLPTIVSRCQILKEKGGVYWETDDTKQTHLLIAKIISKGTGDRIILAQSAAKSKEEAAVLLESILLSLEMLLLTPTKIKLTQKQIADVLTKVVAAKKTLEKNVNYKGVLDLLFLGFPDLGS